MPRSVKAQDLACTAKNCWLRVLGSVVIQLHADVYMPSVDHAL